MAAWAREQRARNEQRAKLGLGPKSSKGASFSERECARSNACPHVGLCQL
jgi:hypothetical protein